MEENCDVRHIEPLPLGHMHCTHNSVVRSATAGMRQMGASGI